MSWFDVGIAGLNAVGKIGSSNGAQAAQPQSVSSGGMFDASGWNVSTGGAALPGDVSRYLPWVVIGLAVVLYFRKGR